MTESDPAPAPAPALAFEGGCSCRQLRYRVTSAPLFVHACHCRWCQRETGAAFALNAMIEADRVTFLAGQPEDVLTPSNSGLGQHIHRCPNCRVALFSTYSLARRAVLLPQIQAWQAQLKAARGT